jgi:hypothetical protein
VVHICNPSTQDVEEGEAKVQGQPELQSGLCLKKKNKKTLGLQVSIMPSRESREDLWTGPSGRLTSKRPNKENAVFHHSKSCTWIPGLSRLNLPAVELG